MARYKNCSKNQSMLIPLNFSDQLIPDVIKKTQKVMKKIDKNLSIKTKDNSRYKLFFRREL